MNNGSWIHADESDPFSSIGVDDKFIVSSKDEEDDHERTSNPMFNLKEELNVEVDYGSSSRVPKIFDRFYDSSSDDEFADATGGDGSDNGSALAQSAGKRLDYMIQYLDRKLSCPEDGELHRTPHLPEFVASGGGSGIFKLPVRGALNSDRPPCLEFRPQPLRETQIGCSLRKLATSDGCSQMWAGLECGVRVWNMKDIYAPGRDGCEDEVPFYESVRTPPALCLIVDAGKRVVWSGHKDGRIRCWNMDRSEDPFSECLSWQAHSAPVLSMIISTYGDLWSGSEGGAVMIWPWEAIEKSLSLVMEERHMAALIIERSYFDPRNQVMVNGVCCSLFSADVKYMLSDHSGGKVWSASYLSFVIWDACSRELVKAFNIDGQSENFLAIQDPSMDKAQNNFNFFQRSRNAIMGAADVVRRVAAKGSIFDDNRRTEALVITIGGIIWTGSANGLLVQWDGNGNRLQDFQYRSDAVSCLCAFGLRVWVGYASGTLQVLDLNGKLIKEWSAHYNPLIDIAVGPGYIFTLANNGGIRGWSITSPGPLDSILGSELAVKEFLYTKLENLKILVGTWNVGQGRATRDSLISWLGSTAGEVDIVVVGLQEVEMGAGFLAMSAAKETMQIGLEGSSAGQWWLDMIGSTLDEGSSFQRIGSRQLAGLLIAVWVRNNIRGSVGDVDAAAVPCGFGRAIGNKGAVGLRLNVYGRTMCFVNCHFAAHMEAVSRRNADFDHVYRTLTFSRPSNLLNSSAAGISSAFQMLRVGNVMVTSSLEGMPDLSEADMVVFLGDFNYRLDGISYDEARDFVSQRSFDWLKEKDQLHAEMKAGNAFQGLREAVIRFPPTYKFERHQAGLAGYDSSEKKRIPAWCDRILYRDNRSTSAFTCNLDCPVVSSVLQYDACMDVTDSDHKPVHCIFSAEIARVDESIRRQEFGEIIRSHEEIRRMLEEHSKVPEVIFSTNNIILQNQDTSILRITNKCGKKKALFKVICEGQCTIKDGIQTSSHHPRGSFGFPRWLEVRPTAGVIEPNHIEEISVHHQGYETLEEFVDGVPRNSWCEDVRDKQVMLIVEVRGSCTYAMKSHRVRVCHSISAKTVPMEHKPSKSSHIPANVLYRSDIDWLSSNVVDDLKNLHTP